MAKQNPVFGTPVKRATAPNPLSPSPNSAQKPIGQLKPSAVPAPSALTKAFAPKR